MIEQLSTSVFHAAEMPPSPPPAPLSVNVVYDQTAGTITYNDQNPLTLAVSDVREIVLSIAPGQAGDPAFQSFAISPLQWSDQISVSYLSATQMQLVLPEALTGNFKFTPLLNVSAKPGTITLQVSAGNPTEAPPDSNPTVYAIEVTVDETQKNPIVYTPSSVSVQPGNAIVTLTASEGIAFYGFSLNLQGSASLSPWPDAMTVAMTESTITITVPNIEQSNIAGTFGFVSLVALPNGDLPLGEELHAGSNQDPTIINIEPTEGGIEPGPTQKITAAAS
jgi:hypothetical protein